MTYQVTVNDKEQRFEVTVNNQLAHTDFRFYHGDLALMHTFVPEPIRNKGVATALAKFSLEYARDNKYKIMVYCPTIAKYIKFHPEFKELIDERYFQVYEKKIK